MSEQKQPDPVQAHGQKYARAFVQRLQEDVRRDIEFKEQLCQLSSSQLIKLLKGEDRNE